MERHDLTPKELEDKPVVDPAGRLLGRVRRVAYDPGRGVEGFDVEVDDDTRTRFASLGPFVALVPEEVASVGAGQVVVHAELEELLGRAAQRARERSATRRPAGRPGERPEDRPEDRPEGPRGEPTRHRLDVGPDSTVGLELLGEPPVDPDWDED